MVPRFTSLATMAAGNCFVAVTGGGKVRWTAPYGAAARSDNHEQPCVTDGACSDSERKIPL